MILLLVSFFGNRSLEQRALDASRGLNGIASASNAVPAEDSLRKLDTLRQSLVELTDYEHNGAPLHLRWGLYSGKRSPAQRPTGFTTRSSANCYSARPKPASLRSYSGLRRHRVHPMITAMATIHLRAIC